MLVRWAILILCLSRALGASTTSSSIDEKLNNFKYKTIASGHKGYLRRFLQEIDYCDFPLIFYTGAKPKYPYVHLVINNIHCVVKRQNLPPWKGRDPNTIYANAAADRLIQLDKQLGLGYIREIKRDEAKKYQDLILFGEFKKTIYRGAVLAGQKIRIKISYFDPIPLGPIFRSAQDVQQYLDEAAWQNEIAKNPELTRRDLKEQIRLYVEGRQNLDEADVNESSEAREISGLAPSGRSLHTAEEGERSEREAKERVVPRPERPPEQSLELSGRRVCGYYISRNNWLKRFVDRVNHWYVKKQTGNIGERCLLHSLGRWAHEHEKDRWWEFKDLLTDGQLEHCREKFNVDKTF